MFMMRRRIATFIHLRAGNPCRLRQVVAGQWTIHHSRRRYRLCV